MVFFSSVTEMKKIVQYHAANYASLEFLVKKSILHKKNFIYEFAYEFLFLRLDAIEPHHIK